MSESDEIEAAKKHACDQGYELRAEKIETLWRVSLSRKGATVGAGPVGSNRDFKTAVGLAWGQVNDDGGDPAVLTAST